MSTLLIGSAAFAGDVPCGNISDGDLSIPGFSLTVTDPQGNELPNLTVAGKISIYHSAWEGDHWGVEGKSIAINIAYQASTHTYVVDPVSSISLGSSGIFGSCQDFVETYDIDFTNSTGAGQFLITFQNSDSLQDAQSRISQTKSVVVVYPKGQQSPDQIADQKELDVFMNQLMPFQTKAMADWTWADLIPFVNLEVENALARFARVVHVGDMGTSGKSDFTNLNEVCSYFAVGAPTHAPDLADALRPLTTDAFAADVQKKNSGDNLSDLLTKLVPSCKSAVERNSH